MNDRFGTAGARVVRAPRGAQLNTANWHPERSALSSVHPVSVSKNLSLSYS